jgi:catechol 2,3-dioxygenase-like lactoylglutathione lyase family enzyme
MSTTGFKPTSASVVYYVSDIARTETFYNQTLGLELTRMEGAEPFWLQGSLESGLELIFFEMDSVRGNTPALIFTVDGGGIDDIVAALSEQGVPSSPRFPRPRAAGAPTFWTRMALASASGKRGNCRGR